MSRNVFLLPLVAILFALAFSCDPDDDGVIIVPPRERDEEAVPWAQIRFHFWINIFKDRYFFLR